MNRTPLFALSLLAATSGCQTIDEIPTQRLAQATEGDEISVVMENGAEYKYKVIKKNQYTVANVPMGDVVGGAGKPEGKEWITMITCGGSLDASGLEYTSRDVVVAERIA